MNIKRIEELKEANARLEAMLKMKQDDWLKVCQENDKFNDKLEARIKELEESNKRLQMEITTDDEIHNGRDLDQIERLEARVKELEAENRRLKETVNQLCFRPTSPLDALSYNELQDRISALEAWLGGALPLLKHCVKFFKYQSVGKEFWPNREEAEAVIEEMSVLLSSNPAIEPLEFEDGEMKIKMPPPDAQKDQNV